MNYRIEKLGAIKVICKKERVHKPKTGAGTPDITSFWTKCGQDGDYGSVEHYCFAAGIRMHMWSSKTGNAIMRNMMKNPLIRDFDAICDTGIAKAGFTSGLCGEWTMDRFSLFADQLGLDVRHITVANQKHTDLIHVAWAEDAGYGTVRPQGDDYYDAIISDWKELALCVHTADCVPVVLLDPDKEAVGILHSGWKGTAKRIAGKTVHKMAETYGTDPGRVICCMGPYNHSCCYEVGEDVLDEFRSSFSDKECEKLFTKKGKNGKFLLDLGEAISMSLCSEGVKRVNIHDSGFCTYHTDEFSSWRRTHNKKHQILTYIMLMKSL